MKGKGGSFLPGLIPCWWFSKVPGFRPLFFPVKRSLIWLSSNFSENGVFFSPFRRSPIKNPYFILGIHQLRYTHSNNNYMSKTAVVTGGTRGIGREICRQMAREGYSILFLGRDADSGNSLRGKLQQEFPACKIEYLQGDLGSIQSTRQAINDIQERLSELDVLINNAGIWTTKLSHNADGFEISFMVNHIAPLMLIRGLLPQLQANAPSRIVNVNSGLYVQGELHLEETPYGKDFHNLKTYANTKLWNTMTTLEIAERLPADQITINALHPGVIRTGLGDMSGFMGALLNVVKLFWKKPEEGAKSPVWVATAPELEGVSGKYFNVMKEWEIAPNAQNSEERKAVWHKSLDLARIDWP